MLAFHFALGYSNGGCVKDVLRSFSVMWQSLKVSPIIIIGDCFRTAAVIKGELHA